MPDVAECVRQAEGYMREWRLPMNCGACKEQVKNGMNISHTWYRQLERVEQVRVLQGSPFGIKPRPNPIQRVGTALNGSDFKFLM